LTCSDIASQFGLNPALCVNNGGCESVVDSATPNDLVWCCPPPAGVTTSCVDDTDCMTAFGYHCVNGVCTHTG
jgi:hypothetical protein